MKRVLSVGDISSNTEQFQDDDGSFSQVTTKGRGKGRNNKKSRPNTERNVVDHSADHSASSSPISDEVQCLKAEIAGLKQTVKLLSGQLSFVLSYLGVSGENSAATTATIAATEADRDESLALSNFPPLVLNHATAPGIPTSPTAASLAPVGSNFRDAARKPIAPVVSSVSTLRNDITKDLLSAMYVDLEQKKRRANNIIISGLPVAADDRQGVQSLLQVEFDEIAPNLQVTSTRRLGRQQSDRIQPLLATCSNVDDAQFILNNSRRLRKSANSLVRGQVYVNPDLTKAEASAAFEMRQRRRAARARNSHQNQHPSSHALNANAAPFQASSLSTQPASMNTSDIPDQVAAGSA